MRIAVFFPTKEHGPLGETVERMTDVAAQGFFDHLASLVAEMRTSPS